MEGFGPEVVLNLGFQIIINEIKNSSLCESATFPPTQPKMLDLGVEKFFHGANPGGGSAEVGNKRSSTGKCEVPSLTSGRTFGLILVIGVMIGMVAGSLGTLLTANLHSKVSENCLQSSKSLWVCVWPPLGHVGCSRPGSTPLEPPVLCSRRR